MNEFVEYLGILLKHRWNETKSLGILTSSSITPYDSHAAAPSILVIAVHRRLPAAQHQRLDLRVQRQRWEGGAAHHWRWPATWRDLKMEPVSGLHLFLYRALPYQYAGHVSEDVTLNHRDKNQLSFNKHFTYFGWELDEQPLTGYFTSDFNKTQVQM